MKIKFFLLLVIFGIALKGNSQSAQNIGGHTILKSNGKFYELYTSDTVEIDTSLVIIKFNRENEETGVQKVNDLNFTLKRKTPYGKFVFYIPPTGNFLESITTLESLYEINNFKLNHNRIGQSYILQIPNDDQHYDYWHLRRTQICYENDEIPYTWQLSTGDPNIIVAVIDDGLAITPDFDSDLPGYDYYDEDYDYSPNIYHVSHGTQMATIIGAKTSNQYGLYGIAGGDGGQSKPITIMTQRVTSKNYAGAFVWNDEKVSYGIKEAVDNGARIINFAWGHANTPPDCDHVEEAFVYAAENDVTVICAAGNENNNHVSWPANRDDVISVAAMNQYENRWENVSMGSNIGPENDIALPGAQIEVGALPLYPYQSLSGGTSISCAMASGIVSLMLSVNPCLTRDEIRNILYESCEEVGEYSYTNHHCPELGHGLVNAYLAVSKAMPHDHITITSGQNTLFNTDMSISGDITIENNAVLTISNCHLLMYPNTKIIVKPGGQLYINNSTLTSKCRKPWIGIEVWGNRNQHQFINANGSYYQGYVKLQNAVIENSIEALNLWHPNDYNSTGGIVIAEGTNFINNRESVHALLYKNTHPVTGNEMFYNAIFTDCEFRIQDGFINEYMEFFKHVDLNQVNGVSFYGCDFSIVPGMKGVSRYNQAIAAYSSGLQVSGICKAPTQNGCSDYVNSTFSGFRYGIFTNNPQATLNRLYVNGCIFNNNDIGISGLNIQYPIILNSEFNIAQNTYSDELCSYGIYFNGVSSFSIEDNKFRKYQGASLADYIGIGIIQSNSVSQIYKNEFDGLSAGNYAFGQNWIGNPTKGLEYLCNINSNNYADFYITGIKGDLSQGVQSYQGTEDIASGNQFSTNATHHFFNGTEHPIGYNYCSTCPNEVPLLYYNISSHISRNSNQCSSHYGGTENPPIIMNDEQKLDLELQFALADANLNNVTTMYNQLIDGGSTVSEVESINQASNEEMWQIRTKLLGDSPHLSQEVLMLVSDKTDLFPDAVIFDILAANPDELRNASLIQYLEQKENPLPEYLIDILKEVALGTTYKTTLQQEMTRYHFEKVRAAEDIIRSLLSEPELNLTEVRNWLDNIGEIEYDRQIINTYIQESNYASAIALAQLLPQLYNLQGNELEEHDYYMQMLNLQYNLHTVNRSFEELTSEELTLVENISMESVGSAGIQAMSIMEAYYNTVFDRCKSLQGEVSYKSEPIDINKLLNAYEFFVSIQPNPANTWITFDYTLPLNETSAELFITSATGTLMKKIILFGNTGQTVLNLSDFPSGTYSYNVKSVSYIKSGKFVVVK